LIDKPFLAITMGDPAGVGAEVTVKTLADKKIYAKCKPFVIGNTEAIKSALEIVGAPVKTKSVISLGEIKGEYGIIDVFDINNLDFNNIEYGKLSAIAGKASVEWILKAGEMAAAGDIQAIVTAPINKEACSMAGYDDIGHMEIFQTQTNSSNVATMLMARNLRVVHLTTHKALRNACDYVTKDNVLDKILLTDHYFKKWGWDSPRIGVAALNPHASDGGLLGNEEQKQILPAVEEAISEGVDVKGPIPADTIFNQNIAGKFDVCIAMYHDQGHIPIKVYDWARSISVNLGLPFVRTSVDHGTAFDIAGKGIADHISMKESIDVAVSVVSDNKLP
jgi:4-hydroxythreonine-4-phosphate dehydrogenase